MSTAAITLDELLGDTSRLHCEESTIEIRGLHIKTWTYTNPTVAVLPSVIGIHGGPGMSHPYILPLKLLADSGHPVIFYDQCGCGESSPMTDVEAKAPWLLTLGYYIEELKTLISHFKLEEYYLFGSSWGTVVCQEMAVLLPNGLLGLMLDGAFCDSQVYIKTQWRDRISTLPTFTQKLLRRLEDEKAYDSPKYKELEDTLSKMFTCRLSPLPECWYQTLANCNKEIYLKIQGNSEFTIGGVLEHWSITDRLHVITVPTIVLVGEYDTMTDECSQLLIDNIPTALPLVKIPRAAHLKLLDESEIVIKALKDFLAMVEGKREK